MVGEVDVGNLQNVIEHLQILYVGIYILTSGNLKEFNGRNLEFILFSALPTL